jgi:hypothetical protein
MVSENDSIRMIFGLKIKALRQAKGLSYQQLADNAGAHNHRPPSGSSQHARHFTACCILPTDTHAPFPPASLRQWVRDLPSRRHAHRPSQRRVRGGISPPSHVATVRGHDRLARHQRARQTVVNIS